MFTWYARAALKPHRPRKPKPPSKKEFIIKQAEDMDIDLEEKSLRNLVNFYQSKLLYLMKGGECARAFMDMLEIE